MNEQIQMVALCVADAIESAIRQHCRTFPNDEYKAANIALGGLRRVAATILIETCDKGNEEVVAMLRLKFGPTKEKG